MNNQSLTIYGGIELTTSAVGLTLNALALPYFVSKREHFSNILYVMIVMTDISTCLVGIPSSLSHLIREHPLLATQKWLCTLTGIIYLIAARFSVFLIAVLSVCRSVCLMFPLRKVRYSIAGSVVIVVYFTILVIQAFLPIFFTEQGYVYRDFIGFCSWAIEWLSFVDGIQSPTWYGLVYTFIIMPWLLPGLIVIISSMITIWRLAKSHLRRQSLGPNATNQTKSATITVVLMTMLYVVFNMPCWILYLTLLWSTTHPVGWLQSGIGVHLSYFVSKLSVEFNAVSNPFVYILRMSDLNLITANSRRRILSLTRTLSRGGAHHIIDTAVRPPYIRRTNNNNTSNNSHVVENNIAIMDVVKCPSSVVLNGEEHSV